MKYASLSVEKKNCYIFLQSFQIHIWLSESLRQNKRKNPTCQIFQVQWEKYALAEEENQTNNHLHLNFNMKYCFSKNSRAS